MDETAKLRLECLKLADAARKAGDKRDVLALAEIFLRWVRDGVLPEVMPGNVRPPSVQPSLPLLKERAADAPKTIKDMVLTVLAESPRGLTALEILDQIQKRWWPQLERTSLSPQLSRLKGDEEIAHEHGLYRPRKKDASPAETDEASND